MFVYLSGRREGKTKLIIDWFFEDPENRGIIVHSVKARERMMRDLHQRFALQGREVTPGWLNRHVMGVESVTDGAVRAWPYKWAIDDLDMILERLFRCELDLVTMTATSITGKEMREQATVSEEHRSDEPGPRGKHGVDVLRPYWRDPDPLGPGAVTYTPGF